MNLFQFPAIYHTFITAVRRVIPILLSAIIIGCNSSPSREALYMEGDSKSYIAAVDDGFFKVITSSAATTKIAGIDGIRVKWSRFNTGSGFVSVGERKILVRLWGENKKMALPIGSPVGKVETFGCITFEAQSSRNYEVSTVIGNSGYLVAIAEVTDGSKGRRVIHTASVPFDSAATLETCRPLSDGTPNRHRDS